MALLFNTHSAKSKEKLNRFFGEQLQISVGGSVEKLNSYYVQGEAAEARKRNSISTIDELLASPLLESPAIQNTSLSFASLNDDSRKARQILGDVVMDTSLAKIHSDGLSALYSSHFPLCYFLAFLLAEQSCEVLFFRMDVVNFEQMVFKSVKKMHSTAQAIFDSYLAQDSVLEINVSEKTKRAVNQSINAYSSTCFHPALLELQPGLETLFKRFLSSSQYDEMASQIPVHQVIRTTEQASNLLNYMKKFMPSAKSSETEFLAKRRRIVNSNIELLLNDKIGRFL